MLIAPKTALYVASQSRLYTAHHRLHIFTQLRQNSVNDNASALSHTPIEVTRLPRLTTKTIAIALLSLAAASCTWAQTAQKLSLPELEEMMFIQSPALRGAASATAAAAAAVDTARTVPNPQIEVMNGTRKPRVDMQQPNGNLKTISITQDLDMPWHRFHE
jgi:outer membrane protein TolC